MGVAGLPLANSFLVSEGSIACICPPEPAPDPAFALAAIAAACLPASPADALAAIGDGMVPAAAGSAPLRSVSAADLVQDGPRRRRRKSKPEPALSAPAAPAFGGGRGRGRGRGRPAGAGRAAAADNSSAAEALLALLGAMEEGDEGGGLDPERSMWVMVALPVGC